MRDVGKELFWYELLSPGFPFPCLLKLVGFMFNSLLMVLVEFDAAERELLPWSLFSKGGSLSDCSRDFGIRGHIIIILLLLLAYHHHL